ncbi:hypothetical protein [Methylobacillus flagellatus]|uniref:hypothetical protein n=1 Tax=Methylobacillus flagellatus TaxID=405 RepID=UPI001484C8AA|nr:hypothetical protein [Methylobacillus flagellatus]
MDKTVTSSISNVDFQIQIPQDELLVLAIPSNMAAASGGGLLFALIDSSISASRQSKQEEAANAFYDKADFIDFRTRFGEAFKAAMADQTSLPKLDISVTPRQTSDEGMESKRSALKPDQAFIAFQVWYAFSKDSRQIMVSTGTSMVASSKPEKVYKTVIHYLSQPVSGDNPLDKWTENNNQALDQAFMESAKDIAALLKRDLEMPATEIIMTELASQEEVKITLPTIIPYFFKGRVVEKTDQRQIIRAENGELYSLPK